MFDGNGNWTSDFSAQADRDNGIKILASRFDNIFIADIKESFENCLTKDGQIAPIGNFNMGGQKITSLANGTNDGDAVNKSQYNALDNAVVHKTGNETINGTKTFSVEPQFSIPTTFGSSDVGFYLNFKDQNSVISGALENRLNNDYSGSSTTNIFSQCPRNGGGIVQAFIGAHALPDGRIFASAPASDEVNSIVTTGRINKAANGYVKLGNGIIIQWGSANGNYVTFGTPFTSTPRVAVACNEGGHTYNSGAENITNTGFQALAYSITWIAIGY